MKKQPIIKVIDNYYSISVHLRRAFFLLGHSLST